LTNVTQVASSPSSLIGAGAGDMFLMVKGAKHGVIKGESQDDQHKGEIDVLGWSWGMQAKPSFGGGVATGKATINELKIVKHLDSASTALMLALRTNEPIQKALLTLRKAGKSQLEYLKITIEQGRVTSLIIDAGDTSGSPDVVERVSFSFNKIEVEYVPQGKDGLPQGGMTFADQWSDQT
jgi:type VI secretion system secreted protein Hcp